MRSRRARRMLAPSHQHAQIRMPRYLVERPYANGLARATGEYGKATREHWVRNNSDIGVSWLHSYVDEAGQRSYCIYDGPDPESVRRAAESNDLPVTRITRVAVLEPWAVS